MKVIAIGIMFFITACMVLCIFEDDEMEEKK